MNENASPHTAPSEEAPQELRPSEALKALKDLGLGGAPASPSDTVIDVPSLLGRTLGQYRIKDKLGQGGMGIVFRAYDTHLDRDVALKVIFCGPLDDPKTAERFKREAQSLAKLNHPNLVHVHNVGSESAIHYFSMELMEGETLGERIRSKGPVNQEELVHLIGQVLSALYYIHGLGITHRDIKSSNIMLCGGRAVLMDFGLAKDERQSGLTSAGSVLGTPEYMAPEQADGQATGPYTDIYSLGVVMYEALAGVLPFTGRSALSIIRQHLETPPPPLEGKVRDIDPRLRDAVHRCLAKAPADRYRECSDLAADLLPLSRSAELVRLAGQAGAPRTETDGLRTAPTLRNPVSAQGIGQTARARPASNESSSGALADAETADLAGRRPAPPWVWMIVGFAAVAVLALGYWFWNRPKKEPPLAAEPALKSSGGAGAPAFRLLQFRAAADQDRWTYLVEVQQPDGTWKQETVTGMREFQKRFGIKETPAP
ncbi:MAG: serine/threonine protein kinase [Planctomycetes bacterium]|nr:serine/threonine protein kinase [Planctomycetota bacterium]